MKKFVKTINVTPKWVDIILIHAVSATNGSAAGQEELRRCAAAADKWNEHCRAQKRPQNAQKKD